MERSDRFTSNEDISINDIHDEAVIQHFIDGKGSKVFILIPNFPFMFIGFIKDVIDDSVVIEVITTSQSVLEKREWNIHIHSIEVFYIERKNGPKIPELRDE